MLAPDGRMWTVGRDWLPVRIRLRRERELGEPSASPWDIGDFVAAADGSVGGILVAIALAVLAVLVFTLLWPLVALAAEIVLLVVLFLAGLAGRVLLRRPWRVVARSRSPERIERAWHVRGWRASGAAIAAIEEALAAGLEPRPPGAVELLQERHGLTNL